ncbi:hypothetical protein WN51_04245 [Melipona quadrifasciata]|uniref:Uncharacterized protein n=1 Tax=Melipona quadrifasciata TaxID=166423 RepID=A0A0N0U444_9HYME|nr:hypothetical protein WN51_04245 [Melipona quadrifasciata]
MPGIRGLLFVFWCLDVLAVCATSNDQAVDNSRTLSRRKRYLIFPEGSNLQLVFCLTVGTYAKENDVVMGLTAALAWELPSTFDKKVSQLLHRRSRSVMFPKIEALLQSTGLDGKACVLRALCEAAQRDPSDLGKGSLIQELLHAVFTLYEQLPSTSCHVRLITEVCVYVENFKTENAGFWTLYGSLPTDGGRFERSEDQAYERAYQTREDCGHLYPTCRYSIYELEF